MRGMKDDEGDYQEIRQKEGAVGRREAECCPLCGAFSLIE